MDIDQMQAHLTLLGWIPMHAALHASAWRGIFHSRYGLVYAYPGGVAKWESSWGLGNEVMVKRQTTWAALDAYTALLYRFVSNINGH